MPPLPLPSLSRGRNLLASGSAVPAAHYPGTGPARWLRDQLLASAGKLTLPKGLAAAPKNSTLRMDGPTHPRSCRHILVPSVRPFPLLNLLRGAPLVRALASAASHYFRSWSERWSRASAAASTRKLLMQERLDPASRSCTFRMGHPPRPRSCSLPVVCSVQDPCRMAPRCQRLRIRRLRPGRTCSCHHCRTSQSTGCFHSLCLVQYRTLGICPQRFGSGTSRRSCRLSGLPKPWEMEADTRRRRVRALLIQAALWAPTTTEKDAILEAMQEQQDWEDSPLPRWPGDADFQLHQRSLLCGGRWQRQLSS